MSLFLVELSADNIIIIIDLVRNFLVLQWNRPLSVMMEKIHGN